MFRILVVFASLLDMLAAMMHFHNNEVDKAIYFVLLGCLVILINSYIERKDNH